MARPRNRASLERRAPAREPYDYVLIVCEGAKTEPEYLREMIRDLQLSGANIVITGDGGAAPQSVVAEAIRRFEDDRNYDRVYCVFDRDQHDRYADALIRVRDHRLVRRHGATRLTADEFVAITSVPCFEYWLLLHYRYTTAAMLTYANVRREMEGIADFARYEKGRAGLYALTKHRIDDALRNARTANRDAERNGTDNPTTKMPDLIEYLRDVAERRRR